MCDLHLALYLFLYVYAADPGNAAAKSWHAPGCNQQLGCPMGGTSNRRRASNRVHL
jgi:hypothetical protein